MVRINIDIDDQDLTQYCSLRDPAQKKEFILDRLVGIFDAHCLGIVRRDRDRRIDDAVREKQGHNVTRGINARSTVDLKSHITGKEGYTPSQAIKIETYIRNKTGLNYTELLDALKGGSPIHILTSFNSKEELLARTMSGETEGGGKKTKTRRGVKKKRTRK